MPTISRFYGITIQMFHKEHGIPHFHARYAGQTASFSIGDMALLEGSLASTRRAARPRLGAGAPRRAPVKLGTSTSRRAARADRATEMSVIHDIVEVEVLPPHGLRVAFADGEVREVDLSTQLDGPVFEPLRDPAEFARVRVDAETGTVAWPTGADLDPIVLYRGLPPLNAVKVETADQR